MSFATFMLSVLVVLSLLSLPPILVARRRSTLTVADGALVILPAILFVIALSLFNEQAKVGLAVVVYPPIIGLLSVGLLWVHVFIPSSAVKAKSVSWAVLLGACLLAFATGAFVAPLYE
jgi:hypothetical protein